MNTDEEGRFLAYMGSILTIAMLAIGPFLQQIVNNSTLAVKSSEASLPVAYLYADSASTNNVLDRDVDLRMKSAIMAGLLSGNDSSDQFAVPIKCTTGNCSWPDYTSLAVCAACADLSHRLTVSTSASSNGSSEASAPVVAYKLPNGLQLETYEGQEGIQMTVNNSLQLGNPEPNSIAFQTHNSTLLDLFVIAVDNESTIDGYNQYGPYASECILEFCVQDFTAEETNGTFIETRNGKGLPIEYYTLTPPKVEAEIDDGGNYQRTYQGNTYRVGYNTMNSFWSYLPGLFYGTVSWVNTLSPVPTFPNDVTQAIWRHLKEQPLTLDAMFQNIEQSMTRAIRTQPSTSIIHQGHAMVQQSIIRVQWPWIALPVAMLILVLLFLVIAAMRTRLAGLEPWKESSLAVLFHGLRQDNKEIFTGLSHQDEMYERARRLEVRLNVKKGEQLLEQT